jgi:hypothetical protein
MARVRVAPLRSGLWVKRVPAGGFRHAQPPGEMGQRHFAGTNLSHEKTRRLPAVGCTWNDGGRSFSTKERLAGSTKDVRKVPISEKKMHFKQFLSAVLRTHCYAALWLAAFPTDHVQPPAFPSQRGALRLCSRSASPNRASSSRSSRGTAMKFIITHNEHPTSLSGQNLDP